MRQYAARGASRITREGREIRRKTERCKIQSCVAGADDFNRLRAGCAVDRQTAKAQRGRSGGAVDGQRGKAGEVDAPRRIHGNLAACTGIGKSDLAVAGAVRAQLDDSPAVIGDIDVAQAVGGNALGVV